MRLICSSLTSTTPRFLSKLLLDKKQSFLLLIFVSLIIRVYRFGDTPIFPDEITWMVRGKETFLAIRTFNIGHISDFFNSANAWWKIADDTESIALPLVGIIGPFVAYLGKGQSIVSRNILADFVAARLPLVIINSCFIGLLYVFTEKITDRTTAFFVALLYAFDPVSIAYGRLILNDSLLTVFMFAGICAFFFIKSFKISVVVSSAALALAFLTKPVGILILLSWGTFYLLSKDKSFVLKKFIYSLLLATLIILILWPESWYKPLISIGEYLLRQAGLVNRGTRLYFMGEISNNPPFYYYLYQIFSRLPIYIVFGLFAYVIFAVRYFFRRGIQYRILQNHKHEFSFFIMVFALLVVVGGASKKSGVRYLLPLWPFFYIASGWMLIRIASYIKIHTLRYLIFLGLFGVATFNLVHYSPNYDYYYNILVGGPEGAQRHILVGLCYGAKESADYINSCFPQVNEFAYVGCSETVVPYYFHGIVTQDWQSQNVVVVEHSQEVLWSQSEGVNHFRDVNPEKIISRNAAVLSKVYVIDESLKNNCRI
jgi:hypothetical protein